MSHALATKEAGAIHRGQFRAALRVELTLRAIAGFKGESSEDGDPDDGRMVPLSITVLVFFMLLVVQFVQF